MTGARPKTLTGAAIMELQPRRSCAAISRGRAATAKSAFRSVCVLAVLGLPGGLLAGCATQGNDGGSLASLFASKDRPEVVVSEAQACAIGYDLARAIHDTVSLRRTVIVAPKNAGPCERHALNYLRLAGFRIDDGADSDKTTGGQRAPGVTLDIELTRFDGASAGRGDTVSAVARLGRGLTIARSYRPAHSGVIALGPVSIQHLNADTYSPRGSSARWAAS